MTINGNVNSIGKIVEQTLCYNGTPISQSDNKETEDSDTSEDPQPQDEDHDMKLSRILPYMTCPEIADKILPRMQIEAANAKGPKERLMFSRALYEAGLFMKRISYEDYVFVFGNVASRSRYNHWMGIELNYQPEDIDPIINQLRLSYNKYLI